MIIVTSDSIVYVNATKNITLYCEFQSSPSVSSLEWRLNNQSISSMNHIISNATTISLSQYTRKRSELKVTSVSTSDFGLYECEAFNGIGRVKRNVTLVVHCECSRLELIANPHFINLKILKFRKRYISKINWLCELKSI